MPARPVCTNDKQTTVLGSRKRIPSRASECQQRQAAIEDKQEQQAQEQMGEMALSDRPEANVMYKLAPASDNGASHCPETCDTVCSRSRIMTGAAERCSTHRLVDMPAGDSACLWGPKCLQFAISKSNVKPASRHGFTFGTWSHLMRHT